jgi:exonuclease SbcD
MGNDPTKAAVMRVAQMSDLHYAGKTLGEVDRCFGFAVDEAIRRGVDVAIISGDSADHELAVHAPAFTALARRIRALADHCPVLLLQGTFSHEPPGTLDVFRLLGGRWPVFVADRIQQVALTGRGEWVASDGYRFDRVPEDARLLVSALPTVNKGAVAAAVGASAASDMVGEAIQGVLGGWRTLHEAARRFGVPAIVVGHGTVRGCVTEHGVPMAGLDHEFTVGGLLAAGAAAALLGHIHKHQHWEKDGRLVAYPGSIGRLHYGEEDDKGFLVWKVAPDSASFEFVATPARRMVHLEFLGAPDLAAIREAAASARGAYVRVRWTIPEEDRESVDRGAIEAALADAAEVRLEGRVVPVTRARAEGIGQAMTLAAKLERWAEATGVTATDELVARLARLEAETPDAIAASLMAAATRPTGEDPSLGTDADNRCRPLRPQTSLESADAVPPAAAPDGRSHVGEQFASGP